MNVNTACGQWLQHDEVGFYILFLKISFILFLKSVKISVFVNLCDSFKFKIQDLAWRQFPSSK